MVPLLSSRRGLKKHRMKLYQIVARACSQGANGTPALFLGCLVQGWLANYVRLGPQTTFIFAARLISISWALPGSICQNVQHWSYDMDCWELIFVAMLSASRAEVFFEQARKILERRSWRGPLLHMDMRCFTYFYCGLTKSQMFWAHGDWNTKIQVSDLVVEQAACDCGVKCLLVQRAVWPKAQPVGQMWKRWDLAARLAMKALVWTMRDSLMFSDPIRKLQAAQVRCQAVCIVPWEPGDWDWNR